MNDSNSLNTSSLTSSPSTSNLQIHRSKKYDCEITWVIENFALYHDTTLSSDVFSPEDNSYEWFLKLDTSKDDAEYTFIDATLKITTRAFKKYGPASGELEFAIMNANGEKTHQKKKRFSTENIDDEIAIDEIIDRADLFNETNASLLPGGELRIYCHVSFILINDAKSNLQQDFKRLYNNKESSDLTINIDGKKYPAHKFVLAARSPVFKAMFAHDTMENQQNTIEIKDIDEKTFTEMVRYIYTEKVENFKDVAFDLLLAADKYNIERLKIICEAKITYMLSNETAVQTLILSERYDHQELKNQAIQYIKRNMEGVMESDRWNDLLSHPNLLVDLLKADLKSKRKYDSY